MRGIFAGTAALTVSLVLAGCGSPSTATSVPTVTASGRVAQEAVVLNALRALELEFDASVGIAAFDTGTGTTFEYRADERFGYASTLKSLAAAQFLSEVAPLEREDQVTWSQADVDAAGYSPVTSQHVTDGLTLDELAEAAVRESDNTAMNLVLKRIGGPAGFDDSLDRLGDATTDVVNGEPDLNTIEPGSTNNTTTPAAFTADLTSYFDDAVLARSERKIWIEWMSGNPTGDSLIRAGAPKSWVVADKSGGAGPIRNDIAIVTPPGRSPILITIFTTKNDPAAEYDDAVVARSAALVLDSFR